MLTSRHFGRGIAEWQLQPRFRALKRIAITPVKDLNVTLVSLSPSFLLHT
jgi:hypothetical protein